MEKVLLCALFTVVAVTYSLPQEHFRPRWGFEDDNSVDNHCKGWGSHCNANDTCCGILTCSKKKGYCSFLAGLWDDDECKPTGAPCSTNEDCCSNNCEPDASRNWDFWEKGVKGHCSDSAPTTVSPTPSVPISTPGDES